MTRYLNTIVLTVKSNILTLIVPIVFIAILFIGSKFYKKGEWNDEYLSLKQAKAIRGFCAIGIIIHHLAQRTAASWLKSQYIIHGLDFFVDIGYLFVAAFLFFSGYGLYKSYKQKENYFNNYFSRRILPIIIVYLVTSLIYYLYKPVSSTYTWYIAAILLCYVLFYIAFKYCKIEFISIFIVIFGIAIYSIICDFFMLGGWWYNTIGLFVVGLLFAKFEKYIIKFLKKTYIPMLIIAVIALVVFRYYGRYYESAIYNVTKESTYDLYSFLIILYRFSAAFFFVLTMILVSLKFKLGNKVLFFYDYISLEFYLIQGLFVQTFSFSYFDVTKPLHYIKNVPLYAIVCIVLSTIAAYIINYVDKKICEFLLYFAEKRRMEIKYVMKYMKYTLITIFVALVAYVIGMIYVGHRENVNSQQIIDKYVDQYITYADVNGKKMAAYIVGEGKDTLVLMRGNNDPCPTLSMRYLADKLAQEYKVVVLDYLGSGFSDKPTSQRTSGNIAYEIHEALHDLGIEDNYILLPEYISGYYAQEYVKKYKNEVKGVIGIQADAGAEYKAILDNTGSSVLEYHKYLKNNAVMNYCIGRLGNIKGIDTLLWRLFEPDYARSIGKENLPVAKRMFFKNIYNSTYVNEIANQYKNYKNSFAAQYPRNIYVVDAIGNDNSLAISRLGANSGDLHARSCFERSKHKTIIVNNTYNAVFFAPGIISKVVNDSLEFIK